MTRFGIGVEAAGDDVRLAIAEQRRGERVELRIHRGPTDALAAHLPQLPAGTATRAFAALPLARTTHRLLVLPFADPQTLAAVVPLELRGQVPGDPADVRVGFEVVRSDGASTDVLAFLARSPDLDAATSPLTGLGVPVAGVVPAPLGVRSLLPERFTGAVVVADGRASALAIWEEGRPRALRALTADAGDPGALAEELGWTLRALGAETVALLLAGPDAEPARDAIRGVHARADLLACAPSGAADSDALAVAPVACGLALAALERRAAAPFAIDTARRPLLTPRLRRLAAVAAVLAVVDVGVTRLDLARRDARLRAALVTVASEALPGEPIVAPRAQLEAALAHRRSAADPAGAGSALTRLRDLSERIPAGLVVDLSRMTLDGEQLELVGTAPTFEAVDALRRALASSARLRDVTADEVRTAVDASRVGFHLRARWVAPGMAPS